jgi:hypothetical protein
VFSDTIVSRPSGQELWDIYEVFLRREIGGIFSMALFRLERSDIPDYIINVLLTGRVANRI